MERTHRYNSRERFLETMRFGTPDRVPCFDEGIRPEVIKVWRKQGLPKGRELSRIVSIDKKETLETDLYPIPGIKRWPVTTTQLGSFKNSLDPFEDKRLPEGWPEKVAEWRNRDHALMLYVHEGFFLAMGVEDWQRFLEVMCLLVDKPNLVRRMMQIQGEFSARLLERVLKEVEIDAAIFSEPIGGNDQPLLSPEMYEDVVLKSYRPVLDVLQRHGVDNIIFQTYANARILIPAILKWGFNCLWACEVNIQEMDYLSLRQEYGKDLRLIGGIDLDAIRHGKQAIRRELEVKVPPLLESGGYIPLADGRIREDVPLENYLYYRQVLSEVITS